MKLLVNYDEHLANHKHRLATILKHKGYIALSSAKTFEIGDLLQTAKHIGAEGIIIANEKTLGNLVSSSKKVSLDKYRGTRLNFSIPAIVTAPLDHIQKVRHGLWLYEKDIDKFKRIKEPVTQLRFMICDTEEKLNKAYETARNAFILSIDIETDLQNRITCVGFSCLMPNLATRTFLIPLIDFGTDHWPNDIAYRIAIRSIQLICALPVPKLFFNGIYDAIHLIRYNCEPVNFVLDAMALAHAEYAELPKDLAFVASIHLYDYYFWKDEADDSRKKGDIQAYWAYCARDAWNTLRCFISQLQEAKPYAFENYRMLFKMVYPYMYGAFEGCLLDKERLNENRRKAVAIANQARTDLQVMAASKEFNPASPKQVAELLFDIIGAQPIKGKRTTAEGALQEISQQHPLLRVIIDTLLDFREKQKAISTYFDFIQWAGRLLYSINPFGTDTGRAASRASSFRYYDLSEETEAKRIKNYGTQIQNVPEYAKNMLIADDGFELAEADNNKSEARCVAYLAACIGLMNALADKDKDFYKTLGTLFFGIPYEGVSKELRNKVLKRIVHGRNYLMGADTFIATATSKTLYEGAALLNYTVKSLKEFANYLLNQYNKPFPEVSDWYNEIKLEVVRNHTLTSPIGYTRYFFGNIIKDHKVFRNAVAHAPQNLSVMIINKGVWRVYTELVLPGKGNIRFKAQIHDSIFVQWRCEMRDYYITQVLRCMDNPVVVKGRTLSIPVDIHTGHSWLDVKNAG